MSFWQPLTQGVDTSGSLAAIFEFSLPVSFNRIDVGSFEMLDPQTGGLFGISADRADFREVIGDFAAVKARKPLI